jgi:hypothetical protein
MCALFVSGMVVAGGQTTTISSRRRAIRPEHRAVLQSIVDPEPDDNGTRRTSRYIEAAGADQVLASMFAVTNSDAGQRSVRALDAWLADHLGDDATQFGS